MTNVKGKHCAVTGGSGFVGQRLVEMLVERGAKRVMSLDVAPKPWDAMEDDKIEYRKVDITDVKALEDAFKGIDCVWHIAALVGPYHKQELYRKVNYEGTLNVIQACKTNKVPNLVMSSSPSTRFNCGPLWTGGDIRGLTEDELPIPDIFVQAYSETKAMGEKACLAACCDELLTIAVAPHQVYGPRDSLTLPALLSTAGSGLLRVFGDGANLCSFTHVDNYCHGLIIAEKQLYKGSPALAKFYIVTDGEPQIFWRVLDQAVIAMGFVSLFSKFKLDYYFMMTIAFICDGISWVLGKKLKLTPFSVKMLTMDRWFDISNAKRDLKYEPVITFEEGWTQTIRWFQTHWLPTRSIPKGNKQGKPDSL